MLSGLEHCKGSCAVIMDADLQHPPELIVQMYENIRRDMTRSLRKGTEKAIRDYQLFLQNCIISWRTNW